MSKRWRRKKDEAQQRERRSKRKEEWNSCRWGMRTDRQKEFLDKEVNIQQVKNPTNPSTIHPLHTHIHTHRAGEKPLRRGADKALIIRSSSPSFLSCLALFLFHVLSIPINNLSLSFSLFPPRPVHHQITESDCRRCWGEDTTCFANSPLAKKKILSRTTETYCRSHIL